MPFELTTGVMLQRLSLRLGNNRVISSPRALPMLPPHSQPLLATARDCRPVRSIRFSCCVVLSLLNMPRGACHQFVEGQNLWFNEIATEQLKASCARVEQRPIGCCIPDVVVCLPNS